MTDLIDYQRASEFCNRKAITHEDVVALKNAKRVLGMTGVPLPGTDGIHRQKTAHEALEMWLDDEGPRYFSVNEVTRPNQRGKARDCGWEYLVPPMHLWPWVGLVLRVADILRESVGRSVRLRNLWRPHGYNEAVGGASKGDHPDACGVDLDFSSHQDQRVAEGVLRSLYDIHELQLSVGLGRTSLHVGVLSQRGRRRWFYKSASPDQRRGFNGPTYRTIEP